MNKILLLAAAPCVCLSLLAQVAKPTQPPPGHTSSAVSVPASMAHVGPEMSAMLSQLERTAQQTTMDVGRLSIKKWRTDAKYKDQMQHDVTSVQTNATSTLPGIISEVRLTPDNTATLFKLYRNVDALLDVVRGLAESAGAFGPKSEYQDLQMDTQNLFSVRSNLASQLEAIAIAKESQMAQMRTQLAQTQAAGTPESAPKKIIVDDNEPPKHTVKRKKAPAKTTATPTQTDTSTKQ